MVQLSLGTTATLNFTLSTAINETVEVTRQRTMKSLVNRVLELQPKNSNELVETLPTISRRINDFTRLTPQAGGGGSFAGQDNR